jgi:CheY-like chemotaxis protein
MKPARKLRILLVDDDDIFAMLLSEAIAEHVDLRDHFVIDRVCDGDDAIEYLVNGRSASGGAPRPDLVLLDQRMPRMDGTAVLREIKGRDETRAIPVCMLSTSNQPKQIEACYAGGANFCITKPANLEDLIQKAGRLLFFVLKVLEIPSAH